MGILLEGSGLEKSYPLGGKRRLPVLKGVDLGVEAGEILAIVGPSGAGKSTLLHLLGGLDPPTAGEIRFKERNLYRLPDRERSRVRNLSFGFVFQFYHLVPELTARENVMLPGWIARRRPPPAEQRRRAEALLEAVGLADRAGHRPAELSGGEQQRVAVARALVHRPEVVFCDEPTGNLDSESGAGVLELLLRMNREYRTTFVIVTHEASIRRLAGRVLHLKDGQWEGRA